MSKKDLSTREIADILHRIHSSKYEEYKKTVLVANQEFVMKEGVLRPDISETSQLLEEHIPDLSDKIALDLGSGSGILTRYLLNKNAEEVYAIDIVHNAVECTKLNNYEAYENGRLRVLQGNMLEPLINLNIKFDFVILNPPYFEGDRRDNIDIDHALFGGNEFMKSFFESIQAYQTSSTKILFIYSSKGQVKSLENLIHQFKYKFTKTVYGIDPLAKYPRQEEYYIYELSI